jgi:predicted secreted protein
MTIKTILTSFLVTTLFSTVVYAETTDEQAAASTPSYVFTEQKQSIAISVSHPEFTIKLKSNPTTGYSWFLREYDSHLIAPVTHSFVKPTQKLMGAPGYEIWTFRVKAAGFSIPQQTAIRFVYARPWQSDDGTQLVFRVSTQGK